MKTRQPVLLLLIGIIALVGWMLQSVGTGESVGNLIPEAHQEYGEIPRVINSSTVTVESDTGERIEIATEEGAVQKSYDPSLGIPAFIGRVLLPNGNPAIGIEVLAAGIQAFAIYRNQSGEDGRGPATENRYTTNGKGYFAVHEAPREGLRFVLEFKAEGLPTKSMINLPSQPGRTRDLGDIQLAKGFALTGTVMSSSGVPLQGARVVAAEEPDLGTAPYWMLSRLEPLEGVEAISGNNGKFHLPVLPPGRIRVRAEAEGFATEWSAAVFAEDASQMDDLTVMLSPSEVLAGTLLDEKGRPLGNVRIECLPNEQTTRTFETEEDGSFRFDLARGTSRVLLRIQASGYFLVNRWLRNGEHRNFQEVVLRPVPGIKGWVTRPGGAPIQGASIALVPDSRRSDPLTQQPVSTANTGKDGSFDLAVDFDSPTEWRGGYRDFRLVARAEGYTPIATGRFSLREDASSPLGPFRITLEIGREIRGVVVDPSGVALSGARLHLRRLDGGRSNSRLEQALLSNRRDGKIIKQTSSNSEGAFRFAGLPSADFRVEALYSGFSPAESEEIALVNNLQEIFLQLKSPSGIDGQIAGDVSAFGTLRVTATAPGLESLDALVDPEGRFSFDEIYPGSWTLELREVDSRIDEIFRWIGGEPLARLEEVEVAEGGRASAILDLDLAGKANVKGTVFVNGIPLPEFGIYLVARGLDDVGSDPIRSQRSVLEKVRSTSTSQAGAFEVAAIEPGDWWLLVSPPREYPEGVFQGDDNQEGPTGLFRQRVELHPGDTQQIDVHLELAEVRGTAMWERNGETQPVPGGWGVLEPQGQAEGVGRREISIQSSGAFSATFVPFGNWTLRMGTRGWRSRRVPMTIDANLNTVGNVLFKKR